ncbi:hypothetical protein E2320_009450 [Naja naja]|nr:hypothetical protein E2320_009450 [Naja naja]
MSLLPKSCPTPHGSPISQTSPALRRAWPIPCSRARRVPTDAASRVPASSTRRTPPRRKQRKILKKK